MNVQTTEVAVTQVKFTPLFEKNSLTRADAGHKLIRSRAEPSRAEPSRAEPSRAEPSRAEPSRAEPSRAEPSRAPSSCSPGRVIPRLSGYRSGRPPNSLPSAPFRAQSDPLPTDSGAAAPGSVRKIHQICEILILAECYARARRIAPSELNRSVYYAVVRRYRDEIGAGRWPRAASDSNRMLIALSASGDVRFASRRERVAA